MFSSDNGAWSEAVGLDGGSNGLLKGGKGSTWEGGIRVPFLVRGPGIKAGSISETAAMHIDLLPTLCDIAGATLTTGNCKIFNVFYANWVITGVFFLIG
jgi:arylsulfatase